MINQQLTDFIKQQLQKGVSRETISKELLGSGWAVQDIEEGFKVINVFVSVSNPTSTPITNLDSNLSPISTSIPNLQTTPNISMTSLEVKSHTSRNVVLIVLILFLLAGGVFGYLFRNDLPIIKDLIKNNNMTNVSQIPDETPTSTSTVTEKEDTTNLSVVQPVVGGIIDCGVSDSSKLTELVYKKDISNGTTTFKVSDFGKDKALVCMGNALLNYCQKAKVKVQSEKGTISTQEILGINGESCDLKISYGEVNDLDTDQKKYENSYLQCEYPSVVIKKESGCFMLDNDACDYFGIKDSSAHIYINTIGNMTLSALFSPKEIKCSGNMIENMIKGSSGLTSAGGSSSQAPEASPGQIECGNDIDCFIDRASSCELSRWTSAFYTSFAIKGYKDNKCVLYNEFIKNECPFLTVDLKSMLERWKVGSYSTDDWRSCPSQ